MFPYKFELITITTITQKSLHTYTCMVTTQMMSVRTFLFVTNFVYTLGGWGVVVSCILKYFKHKTYNTARLLQNDNIV